MKVKWFVHWWNFQKRTDLKTFFPPLKFIEHTEPLMCSINWDPSRKQHMQVRGIHWGFNRSLSPKTCTGSEETTVALLQDTASHRWPTPPLLPHWGSQGNWHTTTILLPPPMTWLGFPQTESNHKARGREASRVVLTALPSRAERSRGVDTECIGRGEQNADISLTVGLNIVITWNSHSLKYAHCLSSWKETWKTAARDLRTESF